MIFIVSDHAGFGLKSELLKLLDELEINDLTPKFIEGDDYPVQAKTLAQKIAGEGQKGSENNFGIAICGSGQGICMALNRYPHIRAALVHNLQNAQISRKHNHANVICLAGKVTKPEKAAKLIRMFIETKPDMAKRHLRRIAELNSLPE